VENVVPVQFACTCFSRRHSENQMMIDNDMTVEILKEALVLAVFLWTQTNRWGQFGRCAKNFALEGILENLLQGFGSVVAIRCTATRVLDKGDVPKGFIESPLFHWTEGQPSLWALIESKLALAIAMSLLSS
jgi:hypothetical protein